MFLRPLLCLICMFILVNIADAAPYAYITNGGTNSVDPNAIPPVYDTVSIVDLATGSVSSQNIINPADPAVATHPYGVAVSADGRRIYISNQFSKTITVLDGSTTDQAVMATITRTIEPGGLAVNPAGSRLFVANKVDGLVGSVSVLDTTTPAYTEVAKISLDAGSTGVAIVPGTPYKVFVTNGGSNTVSIITANDAGNSYVKGTDITVGASPEGIAYNAAKSQLYVANFDASSVTVINAVSNAVVKTIALPPNSYPVGVAVNASGSKVYVSKSLLDSVAVIDTTTDDLDPAMQNIPTGVDSSPYGVAVNPENGMLYVAKSYLFNLPLADGILAAYSPVNGAEVAAVATGKQAQAFGNFIGPMMYPITVTQPANGTIAPAGNGAVLVAKGSNETFTVTPDGGCAINQVLLDSTPLAGPPYIVTNVQAPHTLSATINRTKWQVSVTNVSSSCTGTVTSAPAGISCGATCNAYFNVSTSPVLTGAPNAGCKVDWTGCTTVNGNDCTVALGDAVSGSNKTVTATFSPLGGPVKASTYMGASVQSAYNALNGNDVISITDNSLGLNDQNENVNMSRTDMALVVELRGAATSIQHNAWSASPYTSSIKSLVVGGNGANGTTVVFNNITMQ